ncbi:Ferric/cupric reductase transmembrane component B [Paramyrothecium foliicola]|nr:Ferric/cupric reductase transmembrane component B [Paramyrothecium foliicola]
MAPKLLMLGAVIGGAGLAAADGTGLIGFGKVMYKPACAFACRSVIRSCPLSCTPTEGEVFGSGHSTTVTPPDCYLTDPSFLRTMALCISTYCPDSDKPAVSEIENYWEGHLATGSVGDWSLRPNITYTEALIAARADHDTDRNGTDSDSSHDGHSMDGDMSHDGHASNETTTKARVRRHGAHEHEDDGVVEYHGSLPIAVAGRELNVTSWVADDDWQLQYNGATNFEYNEIGHSKYTITITAVALALPILLSLLRFVPFLQSSRTWLWLNSMLNHPPVWGSKHREPVALKLGGGLVPTRGQALFIVFISILNLVFLIAPYQSIMPQSSFGSLKEQELSLIGNRAGNLAMGNVVTLVVFSARNNVLLWLTDWSHSTYLLLHRWLGYWAILHTILHSVLLLAYYVKYSDYEAELVKEYWIWGIVATVAAVAILPFSLLSFRRRFYEIFLATHQFLALLFLIGYYYHIWYCFTYNWGYEIWMFIAIGIWALERLVRVVRVVSHGSRTAVVSFVEGSNNEYMRITIDGVSTEGIVYLCFPTLSWRFWETHPFSVASSFTYEQDHSITQSDDSIGYDSAKKDEDTIEKAIDVTSAPTVSSTPVSHYGVKTRPGATFVVRTRSGVTRNMSNKLAQASGPIRIPVFLEGSYHSAPLDKLAHCTTIVCIAGGVGVTAVLPLLHANGPRAARLFWGMRHESLARELSDLVGKLPPSVQVITASGERLDIDEILRDELIRRRDDHGPLGIVVSGPSGMADQVRMTATGLGRSGQAREFILVDEGFSW